jgi:hypothetical protein
MFFRVGMLALTLAVGFAGTARAEEVTLGMVGSLRWDTDAYRDEGRNVNAFRGGVGPRVRLRREDRIFRYDASYEGRYERTVDNQARDTFDHIGRLTGTWNLGRRTRLDFRDALVSTERPVFFASADDPGDLPGAQDDNIDDTDRTTRNQATLTLVHQLDPRWAIVGSATHAITEASTDRRFDSIAVGGSLYSSYAWDAKTTLLGGSTVNYTSIDGNQVQSGSRTRSVQLFGGFEYRPRPDIEISVTGGPAFIRTKAARSDTTGQDVPRFRPAGFLPDGQAYAFDTCDVTDGTPLFGAYVNTSAGRLGVAQGCPDRVVSGVNGEPLDSIGVDEGEFTTISGDQVDEDSLTFFAEASISKQWRNFNAEISYSRSETPSTESSGATSLDLVRGFVVYAPPGPWRLRLGADWSLRRSIGDVQVAGVEGAPGIFVETAADSGLRGLDSNGNIRPIAQVDNLFTRSVSGAVETYQWSVIGSARREFDDNAAVTLQLRYRRFNEKGDLRRDRTRGRLVASLRVEANLDPFEF